MKLLVLKDDVNWCFRYSSLFIHPSERELEQWKERDLHKSRNDTYVNVDFEYSVWQF
jgi:hypothetical protein